jgi:HSP20 family protein
MSLIKWNPNANPLSVRNEWDHFLTEFFGNGWEKNSNVWSPSVDISEDENEFTITADLPGISKKDINMNVKENVLTVSGNRNYEKKDENDTYNRMERGYGQFSRSFQLPDNVMENKITANFKNGVLTVCVPKSEELKPKEIAIKVS